MPVLGGNWLMTEADKPETPTRKHSFDSDDEVTRILHRVKLANLEKTLFINRCIKLGWQQAWSAFEDERKRHEAEILRETGKPYKPPKK